MKEDVHHLVQLMKHKLLPSSGECQVDAMEPDIKYSYNEAMFLGKMKNGRVFDIRTQALS